jgi:hypothetical protein
MLEEVGFDWNFSVNSRTLFCCAGGMRAKAVRNSLAMATVGIIFHL